eukprot:TRINITY_DN12833_c1_g1_i2.p1 TRINITY_DN12833_c1_g1~~TRINITY_DN12833_c1_g1_i2.p1  ORF type:complete len:353 (+),score=26.61 TRINITY_DN12833_c1_g1_i2:426-1484(+)
MGLLTPRKMGQKDILTTVRSNYQTIFVTLVNFASYSSWTLLIKWQFKLYGMNFSVLLAAYQMLFVGAVSSLYLLATNRFKYPTKSVLLRVLPLGLVRSTDIGFGNAALRLISVALQQIIKSTIPVYVCVLSSIVLKKAVSYRVWLALVPIIGGVILASWGKLTASWLGVLMAVTSCIARAGKAIINDMLLHATTEEDRLDTMQIMSFESPISGVILTVAGVVFEGGAVFEWYSRTDRSSIPTVMFFNSLCGLLMLLNQWSYISIIKHTSSVTCQVLMNLKMVTLIFISVLLFNTQLLPLHVLGMCVATVGCTSYAFIKQHEEAALKMAASMSDMSEPSPVRNQSISRRNELV